MAQTERGLHGKTLKILITIASSFGYGLFGYDQGVMGGLITGSSFQAVFPSTVTNSQLLGTVVSIYQIGCFFGAFGVYLYGEYLGRRKTIFLGIGWLLIGTTIQASSYSVAQLIVGRIVTGLGTGHMTASISVWLAECTDANWRGSHVAAQFTICNCGITLAYWLDYGLSYTSSQAQWRFPIAFQAVFGLICLVMVIFLPESPRWLIAHGKFEEAHTVLWKLSSLKDIPKDHFSIVEQFDIIKYAFEREKELGSNSSWRAVFTNKKEQNFRRTMLGVGGQFMLQLSGVNCIAYYVSYIFEEVANLPHETSELLSGFLGVWYVVAISTNIYLLDRIGRRVMYMLGCGGMSLFFMLLVIMVSPAGEGNQAMANFGVACVFLVMGSFQFGMLTVSWIWQAEYPPLQIRTQAAALGTMSQWIFGFMVVEITPISITNIGYKTFIYYCIFCALFVPVVYLYYPETARLSLEEIDSIFTKEPILDHQNPESHQLEKKDEETNLA